MFKKRLLLPLITMLFLSTMFFLSAQNLIIKNDYTLAPIGLPEKERLHFSSLIAENPNYFGTEKIALQPPVVKMKGITKYEQLTNVGLYPEKDLLEAFVEIKLPYGYNDSLCGEGSFEYVRFFADWDQDGLFISENEDLGLSQVNVHDIPNTTDKCLPSAKPLSYSVYLKIDPEKWYCKKPQLIKIRAILSWQKEPTAGNPNFIPVWGNTLEKWVQIQPLSQFYLLKNDALALEKPLLEIQELEEVQLPIEEDEYVYSPQELQKIYSKLAVSELRYNFSNLSQKFLTKPEEILSLTEIYPEYLKMELPTVKYEQLNTVGLNYDLDELAGQVTIKRSYGYSGDLCSAGSKEYVTFWLYVWNPVTRRCQWQFAGTTSFKVHDISTIPKEGLDYAVRIPSALQNLKDICANPVVLKLRGILSWGIAPPSNNPDYLPVWGNRVEKNIQLKPLYEQTSGNAPFISVVGGMAVSSIAGNDQTTITSEIGPGYANGASVLGGHPAIESPFGSTVTIGGHIANPPDISSGALPFKYQMQYRKKSSPANPWHNVENKFRIWISTWNGSNWNMTSKIQSPQNGWYTYEEDFTGPVMRFVEGNVFSQWASSTAIEGDGSYEIRIALDNNTGNPPVYSNLIILEIDNTRPEAILTLDAGECSKFYAGDPITGRFTATDKHIYLYKLVITPTSNPPWVSPASETFLSFTPPTTGYTDEPYVIDTNTTPSCGYVIKLQVWDRTIRNNHFNGYYSTDHQGFCILE